MELHLRQRQLAFTLHENLLWPVDHDLGDGIVFQKRLQRSQPQHLIANIGHDARPIAPRHGKGIVVQYSVAVRGNQRLDLLTGIVASRKHLPFLGVHLVHDSSMDIEFYLLISVFCRFRAPPGKNRPLPKRFARRPSQTFQQC